MIPTRQKRLERMLAERIVAVVRCDDRGSAAEAIDAIARGGIHIIEITATTPGAEHLVLDHASRGDLLVGAGTVLDIADAGRFFDAGAEFYASPVFDRQVLEAAHAADRVSMPGAMTPTEAYMAWKAGADIVKLFPMPADGEKYLRALRGPFPTMPVAPSGGVTDRTAVGLLRAGALVLNVGTWLTHEADGSIMPERIEERARGLAEAVREWGVDPGTEF